MNINAAPAEITNLYGSNHTANYKLEGGQTLTAILDYWNTHQTSLLDSDRSAKDLLWTFSADGFKQYSEELRIASSNTVKTRYAASWFHLNEIASTDRKATIGQDAATTLVRHPLLPFPLPFATITGKAVGAAASNSGKIETHSYAVFGMLDHDLTAALTVNLGWRYTHETKGILFNLDGSTSGNLWIGNLAIIVTPARKTFSRQSLAPRIRSIRSKMFISSTLVALKVVVGITVKGKLGIYGEYSYHGSSYYDPSTT